MRLLVPTLSPSASSGTITLASLLPAITAAGNYYRYYDRCAFSATGSNRCRRSRDGSMVLINRKLRQALTES